MLVFGMYVCSAASLNGNWVYYLFEIDGVSTACLLHVASFRPGNDNRGGCNGFCPLGITQVLAGSSEFDFWLTTFAIVYLIPPVLDVCFLPAAPAHAAAPMAGGMAKVQLHICPHTFNSRQSCLGSLLLVPLLLPASMRGDLPRPKRLSCSHSRS